MLWDAASVTRPDKMKLLCGSARNLRPAYGVTRRCSTVAQRRIRRSSTHGCVSRKQLNPAPMKAIIAVPAIAALLYRAWSRKSLTQEALVTAAITAVAHALHPWSVFFALLGVFFLTGTAVTKIKHDQKSLLTLSSTHGSSASAFPSPRTTAQVLANSLCASILVIIHCIILYTQPRPSLELLPSLHDCFPNVASWPRYTLLEILPPLGILANYAAVTADTFSSELGILSSSAPILLTDVPAALLSLRAPRRVPPGTNGGVTLVGLGAGMLGAAIIGVFGITLMPFCAPWTLLQKINLFFAVMVWGTLGSVTDSLLGGFLQASVVDEQTGKVVEALGGGKVLYIKGARGTSKNGGKGKGRTLLSGRDLLSNNGVNFAMATGMSLGAMVCGRLIVGTLS